MLRFSVSWLAFESQMSAVNNLVVFASTPSGSFVDLNFLSRMLFRCVVITIRSDLGQKLMDDFDFEISSFFCVFL